MENGMYCIAGKRIAVQSMYPSVHRYCADYRIADDGNAPDLSVQVTQADIDFERERSARENRVEGRAPIIWKNLRSTGRSPSRCHPLIRF